MNQSALNSLRGEDDLRRVGERAGARICKRLNSPGIDSKESIPPAYVAWLAGQYDNPICCNNPPGYVGWWNRLLGIDSCAP
jgi:hypothetical protein